MQPYSSYGNPQQPGQHPGYQHQHQYNPQHQQLPRQQYGQQQYQQQQQQQGQHYQQQHHAGYNAFSTGQNASHPSADPPPGIDPVLWSRFQTVDRNKSGSIASEGLQQVLLNYNWSQFNAETCRLMIGMFDKDKSGTINIHEFAALWKYIQDWKACFDGFDTDRSGTINAQELHRAFTTFGYRLSTEFCDLCVRVFDAENIHSMKFDNFIQCCVMLKTLTDSFRKFDSNQSGVININYEQFMDLVIENAL